MSSAFERLCELRWPDGIKCPHCGHEKVYLGLSRQHTFMCASKLCRRQFTATSGTMFHSGKMPPEQYVNAIDGFSSCKGPRDMHLILESDYRTAYYIFKKLKSTGGKFA